MSSQTLKADLVRYLEDQVSLRAFQERFIREAWNLPADAESSALVGDIELRLAEYTNGHLDERELRQEFIEILYGLSGARQSKGVFVSSQQGDLVFTVTGGTASAVTPAAWPTLEWAGIRSSTVRA